LPVVSLTYVVKEMEVPFREIWELGQNALEEYNPEDIWKHFFEGTPVRQYIKWDNYNEYFNSTGTTPTPYPLDMWTEYSAALFHVRRDYQRIADLVVVQSHRAAFMDILASVLGIPYLCTALRGPIHSRLLRARSFERYGKTRERVNQICNLPEFRHGALGQYRPRLSTGLPLALVLKRAQGGTGGDRQTTRDQLFWDALKAVRSDAQSLREHLWDLDQVGKELESLGKSPVGKLPDFIKIGFEMMVHTSAAAVGVAAGATVVALKVLNATGCVSDTIDYLAEKISTPDRRYVQILVEQVERLLRPQTHFLFSMERTANQVASEPTGTLISNFWGRELHESHRQWLGLFGREAQGPPQ
jgi:hypothetical protein